MPSSKSAWVWYMPEGDVESGIAKVALEGEGCDAEVVWGADVGAVRGAGAGAVAAGAGVEAVLAFGGAPVKGALGVRPATRGQMGWIQTPSAASGHWSGLPGILKPALLATRIWEKRESLGGVFWQKKMGISSFLSLSLFIHCPLVPFRAQPICRAISGGVAVRKLMSVTVSVPAGIAKETK